MSRIEKLKQDINNIYHEIDNCGTDYKKKGTLGELAVFRICEEVYRNQGGILYHSFQYKVDNELPGNIKRSEQGNLFLEKLGKFTEIDILLITPYVLMPIEVKTYSAIRGGGIVLTNEGITGCSETDKSPVHQNEMHCRHLYSYIYKCLPNGETKYIQPIVVFTDRCKLLDRRTQDQQEYIPVTTLNGLYSMIKRINQPKEYRLNLDAVANALNDCCFGYEKMLPLKKE